MMSRMSCLILLAAHAASAVELDSSRLLRREIDIKEHTIHSDAAKLESASLLELGIHEKDAYAEAEAHADDHTADLKMLNELVDRGMELDEQVALLKDIVAHREVTHQDATSGQASLLQMQEQDQVLLDSVAQTEANIKELSSLLDQFDKLQGVKPELDSDDSDEAEPCDTSDDDDTSTSEDALDSSEDGKEDDASLKDADPSDDAAAAEDESLGDDDTTDDTATSKDEDDTAKGKTDDTSASEDEDDTMKDNADDTSASKDEKESKDEDDEGSDETDDTSDSSDE